MSKRRVVITGMSVVSCFGTDVDTFYDSLLAGKSGVRPITEFKADDLSCKIAAWVDDFHPEGYIDRKLMRRADPYLNYVIYSGKRAVEDAGIPLDQLDQLDRKRCGILVGSGMGGMNTYYDGILDLVRDGPRRVTPFFVPFILTNMGGGLLAIDLGFQGPNYSISTACATGTYCVVAAANHIRQGDADLMVAGGVEASQNRMCLAGFVACRAVSTRNDEPTKASRPWDRGRDGFVMGEGCGVLILEELEHAKARGAHIYGEYLGGNLSCDAYHMTGMREDGSGIGRCIDMTLQDAGVSKEEVNYINAHATSTSLGDLGELVGMRAAFGDQMNRIKINSTKSMIGHPLGGAGGLELVATLKAMERGVLHPTINHDDPEPALAGIDVIPNVSQKFDINVALKNSFGFGGHNACIALRKY